MKWQDRWNAYWFRPAPLMDLAVCRILAVAYQLFYVAKSNWPEKILRYAALPDGVYEPLPVLRALWLPFGVWGERPSAATLEAIYGIVLAAGALALIGCWTRGSLLLFALGNIILQAYFYSFGDMHHNQAVLMIGLGLFALAPCGEALSVDAWRRRPRTREQAAGSVSAPSDAQSMFALWPILAIRWLFGLIYLSAALSKLKWAGLEWLNGYTLQFYLIQDGLRHGYDLGVWLGAHHLPVAVLSWITLVFEGTFFLAAALPRLAWVYVPVGIAIHVGIFLTMKAPFFQFIALYAVFVPWSRLWRALRRPGGWVSRQWRDPATHRRQAGVA